MLFGLPILTIYLVLLVPSLPQGSLIVAIKVLPFGERKESLVLEISIFVRGWHPMQYGKDCYRIAGKKCYRNANNFSCLCHIQLLILLTKGTKSDFRISMVKA